MDVNGSRSAPAPITIKDIAKRAGLSYAQVSRALNDKFGVKPVTRAKIVEIAAKMGYRPNAMARGLITRTTRTIGLIVPDLHNPFFPEIAGAIEAAAEAAGYGVFYSVSDWDPVQEDRYLSLYFEHRLDGVIIAPVQRSRVANPLDIPRGFPAVYVASVPKHADHPWVAIDNVRGGRMATEHLIAQGYRSIAFIGAKDGSDTGVQRRRGYRQALKHYGLSYDSDFVRLGPFTPKGASDAVQGMIDSRKLPDAVFAENDVLAVAVIQTLADGGYRVPEDVAVVGFDNIPIASLHAIELTTVAQPIIEMGRCAIGLLLDQLEGRQPSESVVLEPQLIVRTTTSRAMSRRAFGKEPKSAQRESVGE